MANLYFENSYGDERVIATCKNFQEVRKAINAFITTCNRNNPKDRQFKMYYMRTWEEDGRTKIDVGSHTEFFYVDPPLDH